MGCKPLVDYLSTLKGSVFRGLTVVCVAVWGTVGLTETFRELKQGFHNPPDTARPAAYWCWLNGYVDLTQARWEIEEFRKKGLSGLYVFDIAARDPDGIVPTGPAFMGREWVKNFGTVLGEAEKSGLEIGLITSSSWNAGGPWVTPEFAAMGLFTTQLTCEGPGEFRGVVPQPELPAAAHQHPSGSSPVYRDIAVLAVPMESVLDRPSFVFRLTPPGRHVVDHVILCNTESEKGEKIGPFRRFVKDFAVYVSDTNDAPEAFRPVVQASLKPTTEPQRFDFPPTAARYVKLVLLSKHDPAEARWELGEFEVYSVTGENVVCRIVGEGSRTGAALVRFTSQLRNTGPWSAESIHDGVRGGPKNSWASADEPPLLIADPAKIVDLTGMMGPEGELHWQVPPGRWRIIRFGYGNTGQRLVLPSPKSAGWAIDHFNPQATEWHFKHILEPLLEEIGPLDHTALKQLYVCSYELRGATWTPRLPEEFERRRGYDMKPFLPVLLGCLIKDEATTRRFIRDYETTLSDLIIEGFYRRAAEICHRHGLQLCAEAGGPGLPLHPVPVDALKAQGAVDIPRGEFWVDEHIFVVKETACAAHIYGKPLVDMEAFTSWRHWQDGPAELKPIADRAFCEGANHFTFHTAAHRPSEAGLPGWVYTAGTHFSPSIAWWPLAQGFVDYISRCSFLLQQGDPVADICYYYGDSGFNFVSPKAVDPELGPGYDYTVTDTKALLERAVVRNGRLCFGDDRSGAAVLVLPPGSEVTPEVLQRLETLIQAGACVLGDKPQRSPSLTAYPTCDEKVRQIADRIWGENPPARGDRAYGQGRVFWGQSLRDVLTQLNVPADVVIDGTHRTSLDYVHRQTPEADIYFFWNRLPRREHIVVRLRSAGAPPEIWDPVAGMMTPAEAYRRAENGIELPLDLSPQGSVFVVVPRLAPETTGQGLGDPVVSITIDGQEVLFSPSAGVIPFIFQGLSRGQLTMEVARPGRCSIRFESGREVTLMAEPPQVDDVPGPWEVRFPAGWGAPERVVFPDLVSWTERPEPGIKYFSGIATYQTTFQVEKMPPNSRAVLNLGDVRFVGEVTLNGKNLGIVWTPPYELDVTEAIREGENELVVRVANVWSNRLTGDAREPDLGRFTQTNIKNALAWRIPWKDAALHRSGLIGPVTIRWTKPVRYETPPLSPHL
ncbi:MAG: glycosyl hydrolase [Thermogutta sp.]